MNNITKTDASALSLILYPYQFEKISADFIWTDKHLYKLSKLYDLKKLQLIGVHIDHYLLNKDVDLSQVLPSMKASVLQKEILLTYIRDGIKTL